MFDKPRKKREWLMHVVDCGDGNCHVMEDGLTFVALECGRCNHKSGWIEITVKEARRGLPCPVCNKI